MNKNHIVAGPSEDFFHTCEEREISFPYLQLWRGLPEVPKPGFQEALTGTPAEPRMGLRLEHNGSYVWVEPSAKEALDEDPQALLYAQIIPSKEGTLRARWVYSATRPLGGKYYPEVEEAAKAIHSLNWSKLEQALKTKREKEQKQLEQEARAQWNAN